MITPAYLETMAHYNQWQNQSLYTAANNLSDAERRADRGAFWKSIHVTLAHLFWADERWLSRLADYDAPSTPLAQAEERFKDWSEMMDARASLDMFIIDWAASRTPQDLAGEMTWYAQAVGKKLTNPRGLIFVHFFNHQTHHRGQVHAMLTAAGAKPDDTDMPLMPWRP